MPIADDIATVARQEQALVFDSFDEETAFAIGALIRERALSEAMPLAVDIRFWDRPLFYVALPGSKPDNPEWVRRKYNLVRRLYRSTYGVVLEYAGRSFDFIHKGLDPADHVLAGGGFPIRVRGVGVVGAVTVSGVPEREDHGMVVWALATARRLPYADLALPPS